MRNSDIVVGLDIGTTKICVVAGRMTPEGKMEVLGVGHAPSAGLMRGVISNINKTVEGIQEAVRQAEEMMNAKILKVYVGIAGQHIKSKRHRNYLLRDSLESEISQQDVTTLIENVHRMVLPEGEQIIHVIPQTFMVDNDEGIEDPVGMCGLRLEADFHIITGKVNATKNIYKCVTKAGLEVAGLMLEPIASADSVLNETEKEAGVALVDMGGGTTDIAIFHDGVIRHTAVIPLGGNIITDDIKEGCMVLQHQAEKLKVKFGSALALDSLENHVVSVPGPRGITHREVGVKNLASIIQARVDEIMELVYYEIRNSGYESKLIAGIVLTGGGSMLDNLDVFTEYITGLPARIGQPGEILNRAMRSELGLPQFSTAVGLSLKGSNKFQREKIGGIAEPEEAQPPAPRKGRLRDWVFGVKEFLKGDAEVMEEFDNQQTTDNITT